MALVVITVARGHAAHSDDFYHLLKEIPIGGEGGWDYLSIDEGAHRLYVTHATKVVAVDLEKNQVIGEVADTPGVHGFALAADLGRGFASNGRENKVSIVDLKSLTTLSKVNTGENPDAILYETVQHEVYAFNGKGQSATVIDAKTGTVTATIPLSGKPEFAAAGPDANRVYCNIEDKNEVAVIDSRTHAVVAVWPIAPGNEPTGMAIDLIHHRLFLGCHNKLLIMMDSTNGKVIASAPIGEGVDATAFDPEMKLAFASCGDGTVTVAREVTPDELTVLQTLKTERGARTMALARTTHRICLATAQFEPMPEQAPGIPRQRAKIVPNTLKILVYGNEQVP
jgi:YVTN family beta-propeller protein